MRRTGLIEYLIAVDQQQTELQAGFWILTLSFFMFIQVPLKILIHMMAGPSDKNKV